jgi:Cu/Ag efflux pump CusA
MTPSADRQSATLGVLLVSMATLFGVFLLMQAALSSWRGALLATIATLLSAVGGLVAVLIIGGTVSIGAVAGFLGVLALASRQAIMLLLRFGDLRSAEPGQPLLETVLRGSVDRLAPIVMTAIVVVAALVPVLVMGPGPGLEVVYPLAAVVVGGLVSAVLVSLFIAPPLYLLLEGRTLTRAETTEVSGSTTKHRREPLPEGSLNVSQRRIP